MMREGDIQWLMHKARQHPAAAPAIIEELAQRLAELDSENEQLRDAAVRASAQASEPSGAAELAGLREEIARLQRLLDEARAAHSLALIDDQFRAVRFEPQALRNLVHEGRLIPVGSTLVSLRSALPTRPTDDVLLLSNLGHGRVLRAAEIPVAEGKLPWAPTDHEASPTNEWLAAATTNADPPRFRTVVTRKGFARQIIRVSFDRALEQGQRVIESPVARDEARAIVNGDAEDLLVLTRWGRVTRFPQRTIAAQGSVAISLRDDDEVVGALPLEHDGEIMIVTASGQVARRLSTAVEKSNTPGAVGKTLIKAFDALALYPYRSDHLLFFLTYSGRAIAAPLADVPLSDRLAKGHVLLDLSRDPAVVAALLPSASVG